MWQLSSCHLSSQTSVPSTPSQLCQETSHSYSFQIFCQYNARVVWFRSFCFSLFEFSLFLFFRHHLVMKYYVNQLIKSLTSSILEKKKKFNDVLFLSFVCYLLFLFLLSSMCFFHSSSSLVILISFYIFLVSFSFWFSSIFSPFRSIFSSRIDFSTFVFRWILFHLFSLLRFYSFVLFHFHFHYSIRYVNFEFPNNSLHFYIVLFFFQFCLSLSFF